MDKRYIFLYEHASTVKWKMDILKKQLCEYFFPLFLCVVTTVHYTGTVYCFSMLYNLTLVSECIKCICKTYVNMSSSLGPPNSPFVCSYHCGTSAMGAAHISPARPVIKLKVSSINHTRPLLSLHLSHSSPLFSSSDGTKVL